MIEIRDSKTQENIARRSLRPYPRMTLKFAPCWSIKFMAYLAISSSGRECTMTWIGAWGSLNRQHAIILTIVGSLAALGRIRCFSSDSRSCWLTLTPRIMSFRTSALTVALTPKDRGTCLIVTTWKLRKPSAIMGSLSLVLISLISE